MFFFFLHFSLVFLVALEPVNFIFLDIQFSGEKSVTIGEKMLRDRNVKDMDKLFFLRTEYLQLFYGGSGATSKRSWRKCNVIDV